MYGESLVSHAYESATAKTHFFGLTPTDLNLTGIDKHMKLVASYKKIHHARNNFSKG